MNTRKVFQTVIFGLVLLVAANCREQTGFYSNVLRNDVFTQLYDEHKYDFLWVLDNSGSMASRRAYVRDNMQNFINILNSRKAVDFQMAVTNVDFFTTAGALISAPAGFNVVKSASTATPVADMAAIINNVTDSPTSFWEQGLESTYQAIFQHKSLFSRSGVPLVVILNTDSEDWSCMSNCFGVEPEHNSNWISFPITRYTDYFKQVKQNENSELIMFPLIGTPTSQCTVEFEGRRYEDVVNALGGMSKYGSICLADIPGAYEDIARTLADRGIRFPLSSQAAGTGIRVYVDRVQIPLSADNGYIYEVSTNSIVFTGNAVPRNGSTIEVLYNQKVD